MKKAIILHGKPSRDAYDDPNVPIPSQNHWLGWLNDQLNKNDIFTVNPDIEEPYNPQYLLWTDVINDFKAGINDQTSLIGHSVGAGFWLRYLTEHKELTVDKLILVAPFIDRNKYADFFDFIIDPKLHERVLGGVAIFHSFDDPDMRVHDTVAEIIGSLPGVRLYGFNNMGHFTLKSMGTVEIPELLQEIINS